jgi:hypothetical protein
VTSRASTALVLLVGLMGACQFEVTGIDVAPRGDGGDALPVEDLARGTDEQPVDLAKPIEPPDGLLPIGAPCADSITCMGGQCASGFCCDRACGADACSACNLPGFEGHCVFALLGTECAPAQCVGASLTVPRVCDAFGDCLPAGPSFSCSPYGCDPMQLGCYLSCSSAMECAPGRKCAGAGFCH